MFGPVTIAPSLLSADFTHLADALAMCEQGGASFVHVDVMDGHFVPNLTIGPPVVRSLKQATSLPLDVHLMIDNADSTVEWYLDAGADMVTVHVEACPHLHRTLQKIKSAGARCGVVLNPATPASAISEVIGEVDMVLVMSVNPGYGGQAFIHASVSKIEQIVAMARAAGVNPLIQVDGGINVETAPLVAAAGADVLVAGNAVFGSADPVAAMRDIARAAVV